MSAHVWCQDDEYAAILAQLGALMSATPRPVQVIRVDSQDQGQPQILVQTLILAPRSMLSNKPQPATCMCFSKVRRPATHHVRT